MEVAGGFGFCNCHLLLTGFSERLFPLCSYFLLRHLASLVGQDKFIDMLAKYVQQFHGQQVKSQDFLHFFFSTFKDAPAGQGGLQGKISMAEIMNEWLDKPGMPPKLEKFEVTRVFCSPLTGLSFWLVCDMS